MENPKIFHARIERGQAFGQGLQRFRGGFAVADDIETTYRKLGIGVCEAFNFSLERFGRIGLAHPFGAGCAPDR